MQELYNKLDEIENQKKLIKQSIINRGKNPTDKLDSFAPEILKINPTEKQVKDIYINSNGTETIYADDEYCGFDEAKIHVNNPMALDLYNISGVEKSFYDEPSIFNLLQSDFDYTVKYYNSLNWNPNNTEITHYIINAWPYLRIAPYYDTHNVQDFQSMYFGTETLEYVPQYDMSSAITAYHMFSGYAMKYINTKIPVIDAPLLQDAREILKYNAGITDIPEWNIPSVIDLEGAFDNCYQLTNVGGFKGLKTDISFASSSLLTRESVLNIINKAIDLTGLDSHTIELNTNTLNRLTPDDIKLATDKNWIIIS